MYVSHLHINFLYSRVPKSDYHSAVTKRLNFIFSRMQCICFETCKKKIGRYSWDKVFSISKHWVLALAAFKNTSTDSDVFMKKRKKIKYKVNYKCGTYHSISVNFLLFREVGYSSSWDILTIIGIFRLTGDLNSFDWITWDERFEAPSK